MPAQNRIGINLQVVRPPESESELVQYHVDDATKLARTIADSLFSCRSYCDSIVGIDFRGIHYGVSGCDRWWIQFSLQEVVNVALALSKYLKGGLRKKFLLAYPQGTTKSIGGVSSGSAHALMLDLGLHVVSKAWSVIHLGETGMTYPLHAGMIFSHGILVTMEEDCKDKSLFRHRYTEDVAKAICSYPVLDKGKIFGWLDWEAEMVKETLPESLKKSRSKKSPKDLKSWTQSDLDQAIRKYKADRSSTFYDLVEGVNKGLSGAKKSARKMFGRNAVARELKVRSPAMVTNSPEWQAIADTLDLRKGKSSKAGSNRKKIGLEIALEEQAQACVLTGADSAVRSETISLINEKMPNVEAKATIEQLQSGKITDDQARELLAELSAQLRDSRSRQVR